MRAYFDLSAYTDLAIGFSALFGFRIMENFHLPFLQKNLSDFWRSWHISLSTLVPQQRVLPGVRSHAQGLAGPVRQHAHHGSLALRRPQLAAWGLYHGTGLVVVSRWERWKKKRRKARKKAGLPPAAGYEKFVSWLGYPVTFLYVALGYAFVSTRKLRARPQDHLHRLSGCRWRGSPAMFCEAIGEVGQGART